MAAYYGIKSGMTYLEYFAFTFEFNSQTKTKLSDEQIVIKILKEFPYRTELLTSLTPRKVREYRARYNSGILTPKYLAPRIPSFRYIKGVAVTINNTPITPSQIKLRLKSQFTRWKRDNARRIKNEIKKNPRPKAKKKRKVSSINRKARIRRGLKPAHKAYSKRLWLQKQMARLHGVSAWGD